MKKPFLFLAVLLILSGCQKDRSITPTPNDSAIKFNKQGFKKNLNVDANGVTLNITYLGNGVYDFKINIPSQLLQSDTYQLWLSFTYLGTFNRVSEWQTTLAPGVGYYIRYQNTSGSFEGESNLFTITAQPVIPNASQGWIGLYRYYDSYSNRHYYTNTWEELGSYSQDYQFEKVQGLMYDNSTRAANLVPLYRYYNSTSNDHYLTTTMGTYPGYTYDKIIGYVSPGTSPISFLQLNEYYSAAMGHVYLSPPETIPAGLTFDTSLGYFPASTAPEYVYEFYNPSAGKHAYSFDTNLPIEDPSYGLNGQPFSAFETLVSGTVPVYQFYNSSTQDHVLTTNRNPGFPAGYNYNGIVFYAYASNVSGSVPIYEFYSNSGVDHFYSANRNAAAVYPAYAYNATPFYALPPTSTPQDVYEFYNSQIGKHVYSLNLNLPNSSPGYAYNGQPCKAYPVYIPGTTAVYQFVNKSSQDHVLTTNPNPGWAGYTYQGTMGYEYATQASGTVPLYEFYSPSGADHFYSTNINANSGYSGWNYNGLPFYVLPN